MGYLFYDGLMHPPGMLFYQPPFFFQVLLGPVLAMLVMSSIAMTATHRTSASVVRPALEHTLAEVSKSHTKSPLNTHAAPAFSGLGLAGGPRSSALGGPMGRDNSPSARESPHGDDPSRVVADRRLWPGVGRDEIRPPGRRHSDEGGDDVLDTGPRCGEVLDLPVPGAHYRHPGEGADRL